MFGVDGVVITKSKKKKSFPPAGRILCDDEAPIFAAKIVVVPARPFSNFYRCLSTTETVRFHNRFRARGPEYIYIYIYPTVAGEHRGTAGNSGDEEQGRRRWEDLRKTNLALSSPPRHPSPTPGRAHNTYVSVARTSTAEPRACAATTIN